jgi:hypothetical protein
MLLLHDEYTDAATPNKLVKQGRKCVNDFALFTQDGATTIVVFTAPENRFVDDRFSVLIYFKEEEGVGIASRYVGT